MGVWFESLDFVRCKQFQVRIIFAKGVVVIDIEG